MVMHRPRPAASCTHSLGEHMTDVGLLLSVTPHLPLQLITSSMISKRRQAGGCNRLVTVRGTDPRGVILGTLTVAQLMREARRWRVSFHNWTPHLELCLNGHATSQPSDAGVEHASL
jgi:hypothetical protein